MPVKVKGQTNHKAFLLESIPCYFPLINLDGRAQTKFIKSVIMQSWGRETTYSRASFEFKISFDKLEKRTKRYVKTLWKQVEGARRRKKLWTAKIWCGKNLVKYCFFGKESVSLHVSHSVQGLAKP